jgi:hypothetical protein
MTELAPKLSQFVNMVKPFPAAVTVDILQRSMGVDAGDAFGMVMGNDMISASEYSEIVHGRISSIGRPTLANGDAQWASGCKNSLASLRDGREGERWGNLKSLVGMSFGLAMTRARGSDMYVNERVQVLGAYMERQRDKGMSMSPSQLDCEKAFRRYNSDTHAGGSFSGCSMTNAMFFIGEIVTECNEDGWSLRPDNLYLVLHLLISDVMLGLNFHGSCIEGACNGIGATLLIRNGGGNFRESCKEGTGASEGVSYQQTMRKDNGTGADTAMNTVKQVKSLPFVPEVHEILHWFDR